MQIDNDSATAAVPVGRLQFRKGALRKLLPREHGSYAMLSVPLIAALAGGRPTLGSVALVLLAFTAFLAHEPVVVLLGHRGARVQASLRPDAMGVLSLLGPFGSAMAMLALGEGPGAARMSLLAPIVLGAGLAILIALERERTAAGEVLASIALSSWALPVSCASAVEPRLALGLWAMFAAGFGMVTLAVRAIIHAHKPKHRAAERWGVIAGAALLACGAPFVARALAFPILLGLGTTVLAVCAVIQATVNPHPRNLGRLGWIVVSASLGAVVLGVVGVR